MNMRRLLLIVMIALFASCQKEDVPGTGSLYVTVYTAYDYLAENAEIYTSPDKLAGKTDAFGTLMIRDLPVGNQKVYVNLEGYGSFEKEFPIQAGKVSKIIVKLNEGKELSITPKIVQLSPNISYGMTYGDTINFNFKINDSDSKNEDISVIVKSDLNGILFSGQPNASGYVTFQTLSLDIGIHTITIVSTDKEGHGQIRSFTLNNETPGSLTLVSVNKVGSTVQLNWKQYLKKDFLQYKIFVLPNDQTVPTLLSVINDAGTTTFTDATPPLCNKAVYYMQMVNIKNVSSQSNSFSIIEPGGTIYPFHASVVVHHPTMPILYIADNEGKKLYALNYETRQMLGSIAMDYSIENMHVADNGYGVEVYLPANNGYVKILNPLDLSLIKSFKVGTYMTSITSNGKGLLFISCYNPNYPTNYVSCYSRATMSILGGSNNGDLDGDEILRYVPNTNNRLIAISGGNSSATLKYVNFSATGVFSSFTKDKYNGIYGLSASRTQMDPNGNYFVTSSYGAVYTTDTRQEYLGRMPGGNGQFWSFAINPEGNRIYGAVLLSNKIVVAKYPDFEWMGEVSTSGYPVFVFLFNGKLVVVSSTYYWTWTNIGYGVEVKPIPTFLIQRKRL
jgi:hypothetical protein